jgi:hypothetical protein
MEQIFLAASDFVAWIEERYGVVAAWAATISTIVLFIIIIWIAIAWAVL